VSSSSRICCLSVSHLHITATSRIQSPLQTRDQRIRNCSAPPTTTLNVQHRDEHHFLTSSQERLRTATAAETSTCKGETAPKREPEKLPRAPPWPPQTYNQSVQPWPPRTCTTTCNQNAPVAIRTFEQIGNAAKREPESTNQRASKPAAVHRFHHRAFVVGKRQPQPSSGSSFVGEE